ncbi:uncharacterized protein LOC114579524 [Dendrobium catenatum]|uniref:uncharacterized protein LOC114579524 n=1 Tax=Dendrobium catenatum TaxID=906689 RepID=UPI0010A0B80B|nr:uncharacterized protein LOC114579524 [Dendrobium catenatum]
MLINLYCNTVFLVWKSRNKLIHDGVESNSSYIASNAICQSVISLNFSQFNLGFWDVNQSLRLSKSWHPLPPNWLKVNVDASLLSSHKAGIAAVFRDSKGRFFFAYGKSLQHWDIAQLEMLAIQSLKEVIKDWMFKYKGIIIEGDNSNIISYFKNAWKTGRFKDDEMSSINFCYIVLKFGGYWSEVQGQTRMKYVGGNQKTLKLQRDEISLLLLKERVEALCHWLRGQPFGRPKKRRIKNFLEAGKKTKTGHRCSRCNLLGHHRSTCKNPLNAAGDDIVNESIQQDVA